MSQIAFHILSESSDIARLKLACTLIERDFLAGERVLVWLDDSSLQSFDNLLWTFSDRAFVPHEMLAEVPADCEAPVQLTAETQLPSSVFAAHFTTLVTLRNEASLAALEFPKVIEVVDAEPGRRDAGRARYRFYRDNGANPQHIEAGAKVLGHG
jgi:DNA polymerase-3 subunit chi